MHIKILLNENQKLNGIIIEQNKDLQNFSSIKASLELFMNENDKKNKIFKEKANEADLWRNKYIEYEKKVN